MMKRMGNPSVVLIVGNDEFAATEEEMEQYRTVLCEITGRDDVAIIKEVERGEDYLKEKFETALRNADLSPQARAAVEDAWTSVKSGHDQVSQLKHGLTT